MIFERVSDDPGCRLRLHDAYFMEEGRLRLKFKASRRPTKVRITTLIDRDLLMWLKIGALEARMGYQTYLNRVLSEKAGVGSDGAARLMARPEARPETRDLERPSVPPVGASKPLTADDLLIFGEALARNLAKTLVENLSDTLASSLAKSLAASLMHESPQTVPVDGTARSAEAVPVPQALANKEFDIDTVEKTVRARTPRLKMPVKKMAQAPRKMASRPTAKAAALLKRKKKLASPAALKKVKVRAAKLRGGPQQTAKSRR
jgi:predicted DNA binding CopG/RHH family protein